MREPNKKGDKGGQEGGGSESKELNDAYDAIARLDKSFTATNFSRAPLALLKAGLKGALDHRELTANLRGLETSIKPFDLAIRLKRVNAQMVVKGYSPEQGDAEKFLGIQFIEK